MSRKGLGEARGQLSSCTFKAPQGWCRKTKAVKKEKAEGVKNVTHTGTDCGAGKNLLLTLRELEVPDQADGVEQVVLPSGQ